MSRAWGGLVPDDTTGPSNAAAEMTAREHGSAGAGESPPAPLDPAAAALARSQELNEYLTDLERRRDTPAEWKTVVFDGAASPPRIYHRDEHGPPALSLGIVNPTTIPIYLSLSGERPQAGAHAFAVPPSSAVVLPIGVFKFELGVDAGELGSNSATIFRLRFHSVQPFFLGAL